MNCENLIEQLMRADETGNDLEFRRLGEHLEHCGDCRHEWRAVKALRGLRDRQAAAPRADLFDEIMANTAAATANDTGWGQFWLGTAVGGLIAAGLATLVLTFGVFNDVPTGPAEGPAVAMTLGMPQEINIAIDAERDLEGSTVHVTLSDGFGIDGYGEERTLSWQTDLVRGVNKLTLPIVATAPGTGQLVVRLEHGGSERLIRIDLLAKG